MAWEKRPGGKRYYTRSKRVAGAVVRQYIGAGPAGELAATEDALRRTQKELEGRARREEQRHHDALTASLAHLHRIAESWLSATLTDLGFHKHDRGAWRRRRD